MCIIWEDAILVSALSLTPHSTPPAARHSAVQDNAGDFSLIMRWQAMVQVLLTVQLHNIVPYGWSPDDSGLKAFTMSLAAVCQNDPNGQELQELTRKRWQIVVDRSFGVRFRDEDRIPLERARQISSIMGLKMQSEAFLTTVDAAIVSLASTSAANRACAASPPAHNMPCDHPASGSLYSPARLPFSGEWLVAGLTWQLILQLPGTCCPCSALVQAALGDAPSQEQRQAALLEVLFPLHLAMAEEFGFPGDEGYIRLQANLNEYSTDDSVNYNTMSGTMAVFRRAGISF